MALRPNPMDLSMDASAREWPAVSQTIGAVVDVAGTAPSLARLRAHVAAHLPRLPRLTHYLDGPALRARWVRDPGPDLAVRVREREVAPDGLDAALADIVALPLPEQGAPWDLWLLHGHAPGTYTLCHRAPHSTHDGGGLRASLYALFGGGVPDAPARGRATPAAFATALRAQVRSLTPSGVWDDPAVPLAGARVRGWVRVPTGRLRALGAAAGGSANDAALACLTSALRGWAADHWPRGAGRALSSVMMVDVRGAGESGRPGNLFAFAPMALPAHLPSFEEQLAAVVAATRPMKQPAARRALRTLLDRTPVRAFYAAANRLITPERATVDTSHVAFHRPLHVEGAPVTGVRIFTWLPPRHPVSVISCAYAGTTAVEFVTDAALPGLAELPARWTAALERAEGPAPAVAPG